MIERRLENLLALDYPADKLDVVVASDASTDATNELVEAVAAREPRVRLLDCERGGKVAAQDRAVRADLERRRRLLGRERDLGARCAAPARREPRRPGRRVRLRPAPARGGGRHRTGRALYWRYEMRLREAESQLGSITGGNGSIYALNRADYVEVDPRWGHDLSFPYRMVQAGRRAVYEPAAHAFEKPTPSNETEYRRKVRMFEHCWEITLRGSMFRRLPPGYLAEVVSHRLLRYGSGVLHLTLLGVERRARRRRLGLRDRARRAGRADRCGGCRGADRALLRPRHLGDGRRALELPAARRARRRGRRRRGRGEPRARRRSRPALGLAVASPLLAASALAIKLEDGGPVLFRQTRVGKDGVDFELLKLRTMVVGAERKGAGYAVDAGDSRITRVGPSPAEDVDRRAAAALERRPRRDEPDRAAARRCATRSRSTRSGSASGSTCGRG